jgi:hypothetical protein
MRGKSRTVCLAVMFAFAAPAPAQKDVGEPLEHFLSTRTVDGKARTLEDPVARVVDDFNADDLPDVALWQERERAAAGARPVHLYMQRKDGRFAAGGSVLADPETIFRVVPERPRGARLVVCHDGAVARGYEVSAFIVTELASAELPKACAALPAPVIERLDPARYRASGIQAWTRR